MTSSTRAIVNTGVQYSRSIINSILNLYSTRIIMQALGVNDYGIYAVVGGAVALLGFITNALVITTQRYVSYYYGKGSKDEVRKIFANSLLLHAVIAVFLCAVLYILKDLILLQWLDITPGRVAAAATVYDYTVLILGITVLIAPFKALFIARENIVYISVIEVIDAVAKVAIAFLLLVSDVDRLILYSEMMVGVQLFNLFAFAGYGTSRIEECCIRIRRSDIGLGYFKSLLGFAGWTTYGTAVVVAKTQGVTVLLNHFFGLVTNAAYFIALQINSAVVFISTSVLNAMNPQIMKAEGEGNRQRMLMLAERESKYSTLLLFLFIIPVMVEMPLLLNAWLVDVPEGAAMYCRFLLGMFVVDQMTCGLNTANQSTGRIRNYVLLMYTPKLLVLLVIYAGLACGYSPIFAMWALFVTEFLVAIMRLPYIKCTCGLDVMHFISEVIVPLFPIVIADTVVGMILLWGVPAYPLRFFWSLPLMGVIGLITIWVGCLKDDERQFVLSFIRRKEGVR